MASKSKKTKKPLETSLGKATKNEKEIDISLLQKPLSTSILGLRQVLALFQTATDEIKNYISFECDIMYECRTCRSIFRSLANFILHKRNYCKERFNPLDHLNNNDTYQLVTGALQKQDESSHKKTLNPIINKLIEKQEICELAQQVLKADFSSENNQSSEEKEDNKSLIKEGKVILEKIHCNNTAVYQTLADSDEKSEKEMMKNEVMELHGILDNEGVVLGQDGKICHFETNRLNKNPSIPKTNLYCSECDLKFATKKTLTYHIKYKHNLSQTVYVCPDCKDTFANAWCVYRHLLKVHRKSTTQIRKMREQVHNSCVKRELQPKKKNREVERLMDKDEENQWLNNIEDDSDLQMCGGCGKRFERKAALHSHSATCAKRIAVCNQIKENNARKKEEQVDKEKLQKTQHAAVTQTNNLRGASKRKPHVPKPYERKTKSCRYVEVETSNIEKEKINVISDSDEEKLSPTKQCYNSSMEIDTEKMFNIIGISNGIEIDKDVKDKGQQIDPDLLSGIENNQVSFEVFCQRVSEKNKAKAQENNTPIAVDNKMINIDKPQDTDSYNPEVIDNDDDIILISDSCDDKADDTEKFHDDIVKNLDDIIGVAPQISSIHSDPLPVSTENSKELELNVSSDGFAGFPSTEYSCSLDSHITLRTDSLVPKKRKRGFSLDIPLKATKPVENLDYDCQDTTFVTKASSYMDQEKMQCIPCKMVYSSFAELLWHMSAHFSWFRFQCSKCSFVSFNKHDCVSHAKDCHRIDPFLSTGVVLPIPNWKTVLMSHDFRVLENKSEDLSGKHTDEIIIFDDNLPNYSVETRQDIDTKENESVLFTDCTSNSDNEMDIGNITSIDTNFVNTHSPVLNAVIDIEDNEETYKLNVPSDTPPHVSEIIKNAINEEEVFDNILSEEISVPIDLTDEYEEDDHFLPQEVVDKIETSIVEEIKKDEGVLKEQLRDEIPVDTDEMPSGNNEMKELPIVKIRPVRNRIKTYQNDFLYDLNSIIKANKELMSTQKQKKCNSNIQKSTTSSLNTAHCSFTQKSKPKACKK